MTGQSNSIPELLCVQQPFAELGVHAKSSNQLALVQTMRMTCPCISIGQGVLHAVQQLSSSVIFAPA